MSTGGRGVFFPTAPGLVGFWPHSQDELTPVSDIGVIDPWLVKGLAIQSCGLDVHVLCRVVLCLDYEYAISRHNYMVDLGQTETRRQYQIVKTMVLRRT